jgi:hypothetical protein
MQEYYAENVGSIMEGIAVTRIKGLDSGNVIATLVSMSDPYRGRRVEQWRGPILVCNSPLPKHVETPSVEDSWQVPRNLGPIYGGIIDTPDPEGHPPQHKQVVDQVLKVLSGN